jgi:uncharacterized protein YjiS (DUF1127 family)
METVMRAASTSVAYKAPWHHVGPRRGTGFGAVLLAGAGALATALVREIRLRRDARRLAELSDHMLKDIGVSRGEIDSVVRDGHPPRRRTGAPPPGAALPRS